MTTSQRRLNPEFELDDQDCFVVLLHTYTRLQADPDRPAIPLQRLADDLRYSREELSRLIERLVSAGYLDRDRVADEVILTDRGTECVESDAAGRRSIWLDGNESASAR